MNQSSSHHFTVRILHSLLALGVLFQFMLFYLADWSAMKEYKGFLFMLHKSTGALIVSLIIFLILAGFRFGRPDHQLLRIQDILATGVKISLLILTFVMSVSGYMMTSAGHYGYRFYGLFDMPLWEGLTQEIGQTAHSVHGTVATVLLILVSGHVIAALFHHFIKRDGVLKSMW